MAATKDCSNILFCGDKLKVLLLLDEHETSKNITACFGYIMNFRYYFVTIDLINTFTNEPSNLKYSDKDTFNEFWTSLFASI